MVHSVLFSRKDEDWETPEEVYQGLNAEFHFTLDPCASEDTAKCIRYFTKEDDGLEQPWGTERVFLNPPYGRDIRKWIDKAIDASKSGALVVALVHARTDTRWFHEAIRWANEVRFRKGRIRFGHPGKDDINSPFPSVVMIFRPWCLPRPALQSGDWASFHRI